MNPSGCLAPSSNDARPLAICLVSGGLDSCVTLAMAAEQCRVAALHVNYGQRTERRELEAFHAIANHYGIRDRLVAELPALKTIGGSALTRLDIAVPEGGCAEGEIPVTYVPFRNTHILAVGVSWGEVLGARHLYIGATEVDSSGYPDCRKSYFEAYNRLIAEGTRPETHIDIVTPIIDFNKAQVVRTGIELRAPLHLTWSCYQDEEFACGLCDSCRLRLKGFAEADQVDPIVYRETP